MCIECQIMDNKNAGGIVVPGAYGQTGQYLQSQHNPLPNQQVSYIQGPVYGSQPNQGPGYNSYHNQPANAPYG